MSTLRALLMFLIAARLLMPPGICACKWSAPAARMLVTLMQSDTQLPSEEERDDNDHEPGCPASPLAAGMGLKPPSEPLLPPALAFDLPPPLQAMPSFTPVCLADSAPLSFAAPPSPLYLTLRALLL